MGHIICYEAFPEIGNEDKMRRSLVRKHGFVEKNNHKGVYFYKEVSSLYAWQVKRALTNKNFRYRSYDKRYARSNNYRKTYLDNSDGPFFCAYCGKRIKQSKMEVDHVIPVNQAKTNPCARLWLQLFGMKTVNDPRNLVSSCERCNSKKSDKMGVWVLKGFIGKHRTYWIIRRIIIVSICLLVAFISYLNIDIVMKIIASFINIFTH